LKSLRGAIGLRAEYFRLCLALQSQTGRRYLTSLDGRLRAGPAAFYFEIRFQLRGVFVSIGGGDDADDGGAGDSSNVNHTFQPAGRLSLSNSP